MTVNWIFDEGVDLQHNTMGLYLSKKKLATCCLSHLNILLCTCFSERVKSCKQMRKSISNDN